MSSAAYAQAFDYTVESLDTQLWNDTMTVWDIFTVVASIIQILYFKAAFWQCYVDRDLPKALQLLVLCAVLPVTLWILQILAGQATQ